MNKINTILFTIMLMSISLKANDNFWIKLVNPTKYKIFAISFDKDGNIYTGNGQLYKSYNDGNSWEYVGLDEKSIDKIIFDKKGIIFIDNNGRLLRSKDEGATWDDITYKLGQTLGNFDFILNRRGHLFVGPYRTTDNGETWTNEYNFVGAYFSYAMNSEGHIFRGGWGHGETICRSTDDGDTWEVVLMANTAPVDGVQFDHMVFFPRKQIGYAHSFKTTDNGRSWYQKNREIEPAVYHFTIDSLYHVFSARGSFSNRAYYKYLYKTVGDSTWVPIDTSGLDGAEEFNTMATSPNGYIYLAARNGGLYRSREAYVSVPPVEPLAGELSASPNPFSERTELSFSLPEPGYIRLELYNILGRSLRTLSSGWYDAGTQRIALSSDGIPTGMYYVLLANGNESQIQKIAIMR